MAEADTDLGYSLAVDTMAEPTETMTPVPGLVLKARYLLIKEIGRGGQSLVFKARDLVAAKAGLSKADVALKIITAGPEIEPDFVALMHREARRLRDLVHPNIVRVYDMDRVQNLHFMVMEYLEGDTLSSFLRKAEGRKLELAQVIRLVQDLGSALEFAHANGIIHSDLKPGNVFVQTDGSVKLIDFNISAPIAPSLRMDEEDTIRILIRLGAITPSYASPQRLEGHEPCAADDVFSLAVMVYLCLAGRRPFGPKNALEAMDASVQPERPDQLSSAQWTALMKGLAFDDAGRTPEITNFVTSFAAQRQSAADWIRSQLSW